MDTPCPEGYAAPPPFHTHNAVIATTPQIHRNANNATKPLGPRPAAAPDARPATRPQLAAYRGHPTSDHRHRIAGYNRACSPNNSRPNAGPIGPPWPFRHRAQVSSSRDRDRASGVRVDRQHADTAVGRFEKSSTRSALQVNRVPAPVAVCEGEGTCPHRWPSATQSDAGHGFIAAAVSVLRQVSKERMAGER